MSFQIVVKRKKQREKEQEVAYRPSTSTKRPIFWRSPINSTPTRASRMPGSSDQEMHIITHGEEVIQKSSQGLTEPTRIHQYINRPEGEMDMMIGFFLMNGICISFFLLFGLCVIFSCLRKKPAFFRRKQCSDIEQVPLNQEDNSSKPKLKSIVSQVIKSNKVTTTVSLEGGAENVELANTNGGQQHVKVHEAICQNSRSPSPQFKPRKSSQQQVGSSSRKQSVDNSRRCSTSISQENSAMIRHNLLGPLSFDDLHYM